MYFIARGIDFASVSMVLQLDFGTVFHVISYKYITLSVQLPTRVYWCLLSLLTIVYSYIINTRLNEAGKH